MPWHGFGCPRSAAETIVAAPADPLAIHFGTTAAATRWETVT